MAYKNSVLSKSVVPDFRNTWLLIHKHTYPLEVSSVSRDSFRNPEEPFGDADHLCLLGWFVNLQRHVPTWVA